MSRDGAQVLRTVALGSTLTVTSSICPPTDDDRLLTFSLSGVV